MKYDTKGFHEYDWKDFDATDVQLRASGAKPLKLGDLDYREAEWDDLHKARSACLKSARAIMAKLEATEDEHGHGKCERSHDVIMAAIDVIDGEMDQRKALGQTTPLTHEQRGRPTGASGTLISYEDGTSEFVPEGSAVRGTSGWVERTAIGEYRELRVYRPDESFAERGRYRGPGIGEIARAMILGARNANMTDAERRALSEGTDSAGGYTVPTMLANEFIDKLRAKTVVFQAGARTVPMTSDNLTVARLTGDPTVSWTAENAEITASDPTFDAVTLAPKKLTALVKVLRELLEDSVNISAILENAFMQAMAVELDRACLFGSGSSNQPTGLVNMSGINSVSMGTNGAAVTNYDNLIDLLLAIKEDNGAAPTSFIMAPRTEAAYAKLKDANENPLTEPRMTAALQRLVTTAVPITQTQGSASNASSVITGDFSKMLVGVRVGMELRLLNERYAEYDQVGFIARMRADVTVEQPVHFGKLIGVIPPA